jgi:hypothetical protein
MPSTPAPGGASAQGACAKGGVAGLLTVERGDGGGETPPLQRLGLRVAQRGHWPVTRATKPWILWKNGDRGANI